MKYYAVTDDPNELMHYGREGMKWGQHIFGDKPRSTAFRKAAGKLRQSMKTGIKNTRANWRKASVARQKRRDARQLRAIKQQTSAYENLYRQSALAGEQRQLKNEIRQENRARRQEAKVEKKFNKYVQQAREGRLRYGKLSDDQVRRVTDRLALERNARQLGSTEKPKFKTRLKEALQEGMIQGATRGGAAYIEESWRAKGKYKAEKKYGKKTAKAEAAAQNKKNRIIEKANYKADRKNAWKEAKLAQDKAFYKEKAESGERRSLMELGRNPISARTRRKNLIELRTQNEQAKDFYKLANEENIGITRQQRSSAKARAQKVQEVNRWRKQLEAANKRAEQLRKDDSDRARERAAMERRLEEHRRKLQLTALYGPQNKK